MAISMTFERCKKLIKNIRDKRVVQKKILVVINDLYKIFTKNVKTQIRSYGGADAASGKDLVIFRDVYESETMKDLDNEQLSMFMLGLAIHEMYHLFYTDFDRTFNLMESVARSRLSAEYPNLAKMPFSDAKQRMIQHFCNIIEDAHIERRGAKNYPKFALFIDYVNMIYRQTEGTLADRANEASGAKISIFFFFVLHFAVHGSRMNFDGVPEDMKELCLSNRRAIMDCVYENNSLKRCQMSIALLDRLLPSLKEDTNSATDNALNLLNQQLGNLSDSGSEGTSSKPQDVNSSGLKKKKKKPSAKKSPEKNQEQSQDQNQDGQKTQTVSDSSENESDETVTAQSASSENFDGDEDKNEASGQSQSQEDAQTAQGEKQDESSDSGEESVAGSKSDDKSEEEDNSGEENAADSEADKSPDASESQDKGESDESESSTSGPDESVESNDDEYDYDEEDDEYGDADDFAEGDDEEDESDDTSENEDPADNSSENETSEGESTDDSEADFDESDYEDELQSSDSDNTSGSGGAKGGMGESDDDGDADQVEMFLQQLAQAIQNDALSCETEEGEHEALRNSIYNMNCECSSQLASLVDREYIRPQVKQLRDTDAKLSTEARKMIDDYVKKIVRMVESEIRTRTEGGVLQNQLNGAFASYRVMDYVTKHGADRYKLFDRNIPGEDGLDIAVQLLIDESGSMSTCTHNTVVIASIIHGICTKLGIPIRVASFDTDCYMFCDFDAPMRTSFETQICNYRPWGGTDEASALLCLEKSLLTRPETYKYLFLITDGEPGFNTTDENMTSETWLKEYQKSMIKKGVQMVACCTGDSADSVAMIYEGPKIIYNDYQRLGKRLTNEFLRPIRSM